MSIADEWKDFVMQCQCWTTDEEAEREVSDIRALESNYAEAMRLLRRWTGNALEYRETGLYRESFALLARIDAEKKDGGK